MTGSRSGTEEGLLLAEKALLDLAGLSEPRT